MPIYKNQVFMAADNHADALKNDLAEVQTTEHPDTNTAKNQEHAQSGEIPQSQVFNHIIESQLGSHKEIGFFEAIKLELPVIILDDGLHVYSNSHTMEQAGLFKEVHHQKVRTSDERPPFLDISLTSLVVYQWIAMAIALILFMKAAGKYKKNKDKAPTGLQNLMETMVIYVREQIVRPNIESRKVSDKLMPYFIAVFFFILTCNLLGLIPGGHTPTGSISVTAGLALIAFFVIQVTSIAKNGIGSWFHHLLGGAPWWLFFIMIPIEIISMLVKPFALMIRLFANMTAGHVVLLSLVGLIFFFKSFVVSPLTIGFSLFTYSLEALVAFLQAYIFTILTAVFVGLASGGHENEDHEFA